MKPGRQALAIVLLAILLAAGYALWCSSGLRPPELAEDNYTANLLRLENFQFNDSSGVVLLGSSLTGRLLPSYFIPTEAGPVVNLGLDGSGVLFGLEVVSGHSPAPQLVLLEANLLERPPEANERTLTSAMQSFGFRLGRFCPLFRSANRPSTRLYAWLKAGRDETLQSRRESNPKMPADLPAIMPAVTHPKGGPSEPEIRSVLRARIKGLRDRGTRIMFFRMPAGPSRNAGAVLDAAAQLAAEFQVPVLDLDRALQAGGVELVYTDGMHLAAPSARKAAQVLSKLWKEAERPSGFPTLQK